MEKGGLHLRIQGHGVENENSNSVSCVMTEIETQLRTFSGCRLKDKSYLMRLGPQNYIDALNHPAVLARYINDARNKKYHNVVFEKLPDQVCHSLFVLRLVYYSCDAR